MPPLPLLCKLTPLPGLQHFRRVRDRLHDALRGRFAHTELLRSYRLQRQYVYGIGLQDRENFLVPGGRSFRMAMTSSIAALAMASILSRCSCVASTFDSACPMRC